MPGKIETVYRTSVLECISNTPLGDYPYLEQSDQSERNGRVRKTYLYNFNFSRPRVSTILTVGNQMALEVSAEEYYSGVSVSAMNQ